MSPSLLSLLPPVTGHRSHPFVPPPPGGAAALRPPQPPPGARPAPYSRRSLESAPCSSRQEPTPQEPRTARARHPCCATPPVAVRAARARKCLIFLSMQVKQRYQLSTFSSFVFSFHTLFFMRKERCLQSARFIQLEPFASNA